MEKNVDIYYVKKSEINNNHKVINYPLNYCCYKVFWNKTSPVVIYEDSIYAIDMMDIEFLLQYPEDILQRFFNLFRINKNNTLIINHDHLVRLDIYPDLILKLINDYQLEGTKIFFLIELPSQVPILKKLSHNTGITIAAKMSWLLWAEHHIKKEYARSMPTKKFSIFSRRYEKWRRDIYCDLFLENLLDEFHYTFGKNHPDKGDTMTTNQILSDLPDYMRPQQHRLSSWLESIPPCQDNYNPLSDVVTYKLLDSQINLVLETHINVDMARVTLTEKIYKPIIFQKPFILYGLQGALKILRDQGFKTFHDIWDESYDDIEDDSQRRIKIVELIKHLNSLLQHEFNDIIHRTTPIIKHNQDKIEYYKNKNLPASFMHLGVF